LRPPAHRSRSSTRFRGGRENLVLPDIRDKLLSQGMDPFISTPEQFGALLKSDLALYGKIIKAANIKLEN
jgi:tripartite-type tricarboxylate transporter receptor subunit TctC